MTWFNNLPVGKKLGLGFGAALVLTGLTGVVALSGMATTGTGINLVSVSARQDVQLDPEKPTGL